jgi:hypothetical protein
MDILWCKSQHISQCFHWLHDDEKALRKSGQPIGEEESRPNFACVSQKIFGSSTPISSSRLGFLRFLKIEIETKNFKSPTMFF